MSRNREGYNFDGQEKERKREFQHGICPGCGTKCKLELHHKVPIWFARECLKQTDEVKDYISGIGNSIGLCSECHRQEEETTKENMVIYEEVVTFVLGTDCLLERSDGRSEIERTDNSRGDDLSEIPVYKGFRAARAENAEKYLRRKNNARKSKGSYR